MIPINIIIARSRKRLLFFWERGFQQPVLFPRGEGFFFYFQSTGCNNTATRKLCILHCITSNPNICSSLIEQPHSAPLWDSMPPASHAFAKRNQLIKPDLSCVLQERRWKHEQVNSHEVPVSCSWVQGFLTVLRRALTIGDSRGIQAGTGVWHKKCNHLCKKALSKNGPLLQHTHSDTEEVVDSVQSATWITSNWSH